MKYRVLNDLVNWAENHSIANIKILKTWCDKLSIQATKSSVLI